MKELIDIGHATGRKLTRVEYSCGYMLLEFDHNCWHIRACEGDVVHDTIVTKTQLLNVFYKGILIELGIIDELEYEVWKNAIAKQQEQQEREQYYRLKQKYETNAS